MDRSCHKRGCGEKRDLEKIFHFHFQSPLVQPLTWHRTNPFSAQPIFARFWWFWSFKFIRHWVITSQIWWQFWRWNGPKKSRYKIKKSGITNLAVSSAIQRAKLPCNYLYEVINLLFSPSFNAKSGVPYYIRLVVSQSQETFLIFLQIELLKGEAPHPVVNKKGRRECTGENVELETWFLFGILRRTNITVES